MKIPPKENLRSLSSVIIDLFLQFGHALLYSKDCEILNSDYLRKDLGAITNENGTHGHILMKLIRRPDLPYILRKSAHHMFYFSIGYTFLDSLELPPKF